MTELQSAVAAFALLGIALATPREALAQGTGTVTCESRDDRRVHCSVSNLDTESVTMERKLSQANCYRDESWGVDSRGIWVSDGCRAVFAYARSSAYGGNQSQGRPGTIECDSKDNKRTYCNVSGIDPQSVTMERKLSKANCYRDQSWGATSRGIWVDRGCRAIFNYVSHGGGYDQGGGSGGSASVSSMRRACVERASRDWAVTEENIEITNSERQDNGGYRFNIQSKRTSGVCMVDREGNVYRLSTN